MLELGDDLCHCAPSAPRLANPSRSSPGSPLLAFSEPDLREERNRPVSVCGGGASDRWYCYPISIYTSCCRAPSTASERYLGICASGTRSTNWLLAMDGGERPMMATSYKAPPFVPDGELVELLWQDGAVVAHSQAQAHHHNHHHRHRPMVQAGAGNTGASGVTGEPHALPCLPCGGALGGDVYSQLWQSIAQADGRVVGGDAVAGAPRHRPPAKSGNSGAGSSRTAGQEVGSSFCGSNLVAAAVHPDDDVGVAAAALPLLMPLDDPAAAGAGASTSSGWNSNAMPKRSRDEFDEDADFDAVDETPPSSRDRRPASSKRRTRAAEVHNMSERRRRDRINEKMRALQELVPHCNKTDKASILDEAIEYLKSLQMQVQIMWMSTGMAPMMIPGAHQLMPPMTMGLNSARMAPPAVQFLSQVPRVLPPFMNNPLPNQMPQILHPPTNAPSVTDQAQSNGVALLRNPFLHPNDNDELTTPHHQVPSLFGYGPQMVQVNEIQELLTGTAAPALGTDPPSSSDGTGT